LAVICRFGEHRKLNTNKRVWKKLGLGLLL